VHLSPPPEHEGPAAKRQREANEGAALAIQAQCLANANTKQQQATGNAKTVAPGESELPRWLTILGSIGSASFLPLLTALIRGVRRHGRTAGGAW
jgi:hypothetical protein